MKKNHGYILACLVGLIGCQPAEINNEPIAEEKFPVSFSIHLSAEVLPFPGTKAMPAFNIPEPEAVKTDPEPTPADKDTTDLYKQIEYVVYKKDTPGKVFKHRSFIAGSDDFRIINDSLPAGSYLVAFLAHSSACLKLSDGIVKVDELSDTFWEPLDLTVQRGAIITKEITLRRIISRIEFVAKDAVPEQLKKFHITSIPRYDGLNILTGEGIPTDLAYTVSHTFTTEEKGKTDLNFSFLTFVPPTETASLHVTLTATGSADIEVCRKIVSEVKPLANRVVRYSGSLYTPAASNDTFSLYILKDGEWGEPDEHTLTD